MAGAMTPRRNISRKARFGSADFEQLPVSGGVYGGFQFHNRAGTLQAASVNFDRLLRRFAGWRGTGAFVCLRIEDDGGDLSEEALIGFIPAGKILHRKALLHQQPAGDITAQADLAEHIQRFIPRKLRAARPQVIYWNIDRPWNCPLFDFCRSAHIKQHDLRAVELRRLFSVPDIHLFVYHVRRHEARHVHRVFRVAVWRRVGQFQLRQIVHREFVADRGRKHVNALIHAIAPDDLRAK